MVKQTIQIFARVASHCPEAATRGTGRSSAGAGAAGPLRPGEGAAREVPGPGEGFGSRRGMRPSVQHTRFWHPEVAHRRQHIAFRGRGQTPSPFPPDTDLRTAYENHLHYSGHVLTAADRARTCTSACMRDRRLASAVRPYCTFLRKQSCSSAHPGAFKLLFHPRAKRASQRYVSAPPDDTHDRYRYRDTQNLHSGSYTVGP